jgi:DUF1680 family protein
MTFAARMQPVPFENVTFNDLFWSPRVEANRANGLPAILRQLEASGRVDVFRPDKPYPNPDEGVLRFADSDLAKWVEAAAYSLVTHPDPALRADLDAVVALISAAQQPDGYLNTYFTRAHPELRFKNLRDNHELYCAGHLMEAAVAHQRATGSDAFLRVMARYADLIDATFGSQPGKLPGYCGHPEVELALVRLAEASGQPRYLDLARYFVEQRGQSPHYYDWEARRRGDDPAGYAFKTYEYCQAHAPIRQQQAVVGHAVRAMYLFSAVTDLAAATADPSLLETSTRLWDSLVTRRMYITGGIGPGWHNEGFTEDYDLPDESAYAETCAAIGLMLWSQRLLQASGDSRYADVLERAMYNGFLSGVSLDGTRFFYTNPLASRGDHHRAAWFYCPCCPPNLARILASLGQFFASTGPGVLWLHQYAGGSLAAQVDGESVRLDVDTAYPWDGRVVLTVQSGGSFDLRLRIPGWCRQWVAAVNSQPLANPLVEQGYLVLSRRWQPGDRVALKLSMPARVEWAHPAARQLLGRAALMRGPLVYCLEGVDNAQVALDRLSIDAQAAPGQFRPQPGDGALAGMVLLGGPASLLEDGDWNGALYRPAPPASRAVTITAVPYFAWDNRAPGEMRVWLRGG